MSDGRVHSLLNDHNDTNEDRAADATLARNDALKAAEQVLRAAREAGSAHAERVLHTLIALLKTSSGGNAEPV
ncbi:hypothetical protein Rmf_40220 [Roseomonas fluvialis]|uniref:Uncharacterized protein n=1 Tax=Roseomonas fluvialis TaxID=1750527 RepID=A0ABM9SEJ2_9PROT|nr:hypothetical protein Rmf_40220 [Roseomonas fluvialis]